MTAASKPHIVVLGAGFGGLELTTLLSEALGDSVEVTLIDKSDTFVFGFSKLDVMFGHKEPDAVRMPYARYAKPGVRLLKRSITAIDPEKRRVVTDDGTFDADYLVVALGADTTSTPPRGCQEQPSSTRWRARSGFAKCCRPHRRQGVGRRLRRALQVPARAERVRPDAARLLDEQRNSPSLRDCARPAVGESGAAVAGNLARAACGVRRAQHRLHSQPSRRFGRQRPQCRRSRRSAGDALRSLPRRPQAPGSSGCARQRHVRERLDSGQSAHPRNSLRERLRRRRRRQHRDAQGGRLRRRRGARRGERTGRQAAPARRRRRV